MAANTTNYNLVKPSENEYYDINISNSNLDIIDTEIKKINDKLNNISTDAKSTSFDNSDNGMVATNVQEAIEENKTSILNNTNLANQALTKANEAFQSGSNVKQSLVDKLTSEGLNVSTNQSFEELISGITLGKKWAKGESISSASNLESFVISGGTSKYWSAYVDISLNFTPSIIVVFGYSSSNNTENLSVFNNEGYLYSKANVKASLYKEGTMSTTNYNYKVNELIDLGSNIYRIPVRSENSAVNWIAFE